jgi:hypothetical protein
MEIDEVCFPAPLNICMPLSYASSVATPRHFTEDDGLSKLRDDADPGCFLCLLDEMPGEDWD